MWAVEGLAAGARKPSSTAVCVWSIRLTSMTRARRICPRYWRTYNLLREQEEKEAQYIATALEIYVTGSLNVFNHQSNVDINNRIVCYDIKELGKQLKKIGMLVVQDQVWNRVTINRAAHKSTRYYIDEMHLLLKEEQTAAYTVEIWKRFRKWGGIQKQYHPECQRPFEQPRG